MSFTEPTWNLAPCNAARRSGVAVLATLDATTARETALREALTRALALVETLEPGRPLLAPYRQEVEAILRAALGDQP